MQLQAHKNIQLISQLAGNTLNQIGQATGNKELQIAGFATNQMGVNASAINAFRQRDGSFSGKQKQKNNPNNRGPKNQGQGNQGQSWGQNNFQPPINGPQPTPQSPWQNQNQGQNIDIMNMDLPAQKVNPPVQPENPVINGGPNNTPLNLKPTQNVENAKQNNKDSKDLMSF